MHLESSTRSKNFSIQLFLLLLRIMTEQVNVQQAVCYNFPY